MQTLARDGYSAAQIAAMLKAPVLGRSAGVDVLAQDLTLVQSVALDSDTESGTITHIADADAQHATIQIRLARELVWGNVLIRPYMTLSAGAVMARFNCGVFCLTTPKSVVSAPLPTFDVTGYDRLYLLSRSIGDAYFVAAGSNVLQAVRDAITAAGLTGVLLDGTAQAATLPTDMTWPLIRDSRSSNGRFLPGHGTDYAWLDVVNDLLAVVGYRRAWADENGLFRSEPDIDPAARPIEFTFDADTADTILGQDRTLTQDLWQAANRWVFIQQNRDSSAPPATVGPSVTAGGYVKTPAGDGIYTVDNISDGPASYNARGLRWPTVQQLDAADQAALVAQGDAIVATDTRVATTLTVTTGPFPVAGHGDVYQYNDAALPAPSHLKVTSLQWTLDLLGADMTHEWAVTG